MLFGQSTTVAEVVAGFFRIISIGYVLYMLTSCMQGYITGFGKPEKAMLLLILYYLPYRIPVALGLEKIMGLDGIWLAFLLSHVLAFGTGIILVRSCKNKKGECRNEGFVF